MGVEVLSKGGVGDGDCTGVGVGDCIGKVGKDINGALVRTCRSSVCKNT